MIKNKRKTLQKENKNFFYFLFKKFFKKNLLKLLKN